MALVDKHKVKRQRLDKICEGKRHIFFYLYLFCSAFYNRMDVM